MKRGYPRFLSYKHSNNTLWYLSDGTFRWDLTRTMLCTPLPKLRKRQPRAILTNSGRLGCVARVAGEFGSDVPGEKLVDLIDRVLGDAGQHVSQIAFWFDTVQLGGSDQAVHGCGAFPATIGACE